MTMQTKASTQTPASQTSGRGGAATMYLDSWPTWVTFIGLLLFYLGERAIGEPPKLRLAADALGGLLMVGAFAYRASRASRAADPSHRSAERWLLWAQGVLFAGLGLYFLFALGKDSLQGALGKSFDRVDGVVATLWPALLLGGGLALAQMQRALSSMTDGYGHAEHVELQRLRYSVASGVTAALVLIFCFAVNYTASERNTKWDLARFRTTRPSQATRKVVQNMNKSVRATLFFPNPNEVREEVVPYFADLAKQSVSGSGKFTYEVVDHALEPARAKELAATGNGLVVLAVLDDKGAVTQKETLNLYTKLEAAATALSTLDTDVQKRFLQLTRPGRIAYFTTGHGERAFDRNNPQDVMKDDLRSSVSDLRLLLLNQGYEVKTLGLGQGLGNKIPGDAGIVFIAGPSEGFLPQEINTINEYLKGGGHVYIMFDAHAQQAAEDLNGVLQTAGMKYHPEVLCNNEYHLVRTHKNADRANILAISFSSHPTVATIPHLGRGAAVGLLGSGWFERAGTPPAGIALDFTVRSMPNTWADTNGNFEYDQGEKRQVFELAGVASKPVGDPKDHKELRLAVLGSVEAIGDLVLGNRANAYLARDTINWLMGEEALSGETAQETDMPIVHTRSEERLWFYSTIFAPPALILLIGLAYTRRVRRRRAS